MRRPLPPSPPPPDTAITGRTGAVEHVAVGTSFRARVTWDLPDAASENPTTTCAVRGPSGVAVVPRVESDDEGQFADFLVDCAGQWWYGFTAGDGYSGYAEGVVVGVERRA